MAPVHHTVQAPPEPAKELPMFTRIALAVTLVTLAGTTELRSLSKSTPMAAEDPYTSKAFLDCLKTIVGMRLKPVSHRP
jgi:hypothetical protein